jgi:6-phosphogluconolactonase (cycloisomerase 2 family)
MFSPTNRRIRRDARGYTDALARQGTSTPELASSAKAVSTAIYPAADIGRLTPGEEERQSMIARISHMFRTLAVFVPAISAGLQSVGSQTTSSFRRYAKRCLVCLMFPVMLVASEGAESDAAPSGVVYVESNIGTPGQNSLLAFRRDKEGNLASLPGSPFLTGGTGVFDTSLKLGPFDSDQNVIANPEHTLLFAVNSGSNTIAVFHIRPDGALVPVDGSPFPSGGINPVSVGLSSNILVVVNKDEDPRQSVQSLPNYTAFRVTPEGKLIRIPDSTVSVAPGSSPSQALTPRSARLVFSTDFLAGLLESFVINHNGRLLRNTPQTLPDSVFGAAPRLPLGLAVNPFYPLLYVGFTPIGRVGVYRYDSRGQLEFLRVAFDSGAAVCWLTVNKSGTRLYASNTGDNSISVFSLSDPAAPVEIQHIVLKGLGSAFQLALDNDDEFLHVVTQRATADTPEGQGDTLHVLHVNPDGTLAEVPSSPTELALPVGTRPQGVVAF